MKKVLFTATVDAHILAFHAPYLKYFKDNGYERTGDIIHSHWTDLRRQYVYVRFTYRFNAVQSKYKGGEAGQSELNRL